MDRDGTINTYKCLLHKEDDFQLLPEAGEAIRLINESEYLCIVVSNQSVVARNLCSLEDVLKINNKMQELLGQSCAWIDDIFICPHHPDVGYKDENKEYKIKCKCRKPNVGMIEEAKRKYNINIEESYVIGDETGDIKLGKNARMKTILVKTGNGGMDKRYDVSPDYTADNLYEAVKIILSK
ncbi:D-glycero-alpha-D-manno-heptose-1,7-bisphosphate 7-phosphatase [Clostridium botulinum]|uniref:D-glycero-alpha-D-manno-heptose-1,7-bisphosphate 7-phosphatase n=1 Tax=Clostridium botulinum TaxID=1491 RepID=UPI003DA2832F